MVITQDDSLDTTCVNATRAKNLPHSLLHLEHPFQGLEQAGQDGAQVPPVFRHAKVEDKVASCHIRARVFDQGEHPWFEELMNFDDSGADNTCRTYSVNGGGGVDDRDIGCAMGWRDLEPWGGGGLLVAITAIVEI